MISYSDSTRKIVQGNVICSYVTILNLVTKVAQTFPKSDHFLFSMQTGKCLPYGCNVVWYHGPMYGVWYMVVWYNGSMYGIRETTRGVTNPILDTRNHNWRPQTASSQGKLSIAAKALRWMLLQTHTM